MKNIEIETFSDEIYDTKDQWIYIGMLFVPLKKRKELLQNLLNRRCIQHNSWRWNEKECPYKCGYHNWNNTEIHYAKVHKTNAKFKIAHRWLEFLIKNNKENMELIYFNILGIDLGKLDVSEFGEDWLNIYNRFFRTVLLGGAKYFFGGRSKIIVNRIYHDKGSQQRHPYFPWHVGYKVNLTDNKIFIKNPKIIFVDSNHRNYPNEDGDYKEESQFIQFTDLILGSIYCCLHARAERKEKIKLGLIIKPLLYRLLNNPKNANSSYHYYRKQQVSFFPKSEMKLDEACKQLDLFGRKTINKKQQEGFYTKRPILLQDPKQKKLWEWEK